MNNTKTLASKLIEVCDQRHKMIVTVESCTGGGNPGAITDIAGSSCALDRSFITYSNEAKVEMVGVAPETLDKFGAVSDVTAKEMAVGGLVNSNASIAISVTGIAGPSGGTEEKPVGLVYFGMAKVEENGAVAVMTFKHIFQGDRTRVRHDTITQALTYLIDHIKS